MNSRDGYCYCDDVKLLLEESHTTKVVSTHMIYKNVTERKSKLMRCLILQASYELYPLYNFLLSFLFMTVPSAETD